MLSLSRRRAGRAEAGQCGRNEFGRRFRQGRSRRGAQYGPALGLGRRRREFAGMDDFLDLHAVKRFVFEQPFRDQFQFVAIAKNQVVGGLVARINDAFDFLVNLPRGAFAIDFGARHLAPEENVFVVIAVLHHAELVAHAVLANHRARHVGSHLDVHGRAGGDVAGNNFLGNAPAHGHGDVIEHFLFAAA